MAAWLGCGFGGRRTCGSAEQASHCGPLAASLTVPAHLPPAPCPQAAVQPRHRHSSPECAPLGREQCRPPQSMGSSAWSLPLAAVSDSWPASSAAGTPQIPPPGAWPCHAHPRRTARRAFPLPALLCSSLHLPCHMYTPLHAFMYLPLNQYSLSTALPLVYPFVPACLDTKSILF